MSKIVFQRGAKIILSRSTNEQSQKELEEAQSYFLGEREIIREQITKSRRPNELLSSQSIAQHHVTESAVLASEIEQLPDLQGFLKLASQPDWKRVKLAIS